MEFSQLVHAIRDFIWGPPLMLLIFGVGAYLTWVLRGAHIRYLMYGFQSPSQSKKNRSDGDISPFKALMTTLAGAIGTGAIVGVSTAIVIGGVGALFWMWVTAFFGMATKYAESLLAIKYREKDHFGEMIGGPMEYIEKGYGKRWMAILFAVCGAFGVLGTGNLVQVNSIAAAAESVWSIDPLISGFFLALVTGLVILGGVRSIGNIAGVLVPIMSFFYLAGGLLIICLHIDQLPHAFGVIFESAFYGQAAIGGIAGSSVIYAVQMGVSRGVLSNEAGLGISSIASAAAQTDEPGRQALLTMVGTLVSTLFVCTITVLVITVTGVLGVVDDAGNVLNGAPLAIAAFSSTVVGGSYIVSIGLILFAFSTVIAWGYYGEKCCEYLFGERSILPYRFIYTLCVIPGATLDLEIVWAFADIFNAVMAIPNLVALLGLSKVIVVETNGFIARAKEEELEEQHGMA